MEKRHNFEDKMTLQKVTIPEASSDGYLGFKVNRVYNGERYDDICVSELVFD